MQNLVSFSKELRRPRLLIQAARLGAADYHRSTDLCRCLCQEPLCQGALCQGALCHDTALPDSGVALKHLLRIEAELNQHRQQCAAGYAFATHVDVLIAIIGEMRLLRGAAAGGSARRGKPQATLRKVAKRS